MIDTQNSNHLLKMYIRARLEETIPHLSEIGRYKFMIFLYLLKIEECQMERIGKYKEKVC